MTDRKRALITGITGQDGSYLAELLLGKGYEVHGVVRRASTFNTERIDHLYQDPHDPDPRLRLHYGDVGDASSLHAIVAKVWPDEIYNLAAQSHVRVSFDIPEYTADITGLGSIRLLETIRRAGLTCRFYQASSSELFGGSPSPQSEATEFRPRSPYAAAKAYAYHVTVNYREAYGMFACNGILFNHESPRRGETFVTRKITRAVGRIKTGAQTELFLGNLDAVRDWGHARDYVEAMWLMLQAQAAEDYVIGTGESHTVREFAERAFGLAGLDWKDFVRQDPRYLRPTEVDVLRADATKARRGLGWAPRTTFAELVEEMVREDVELALREQRARGLMAALDESGRDLIFMVSQPRSGSTLLQHVLGGHSQIHTLPEPWLMLHLVYALRGSELTAPYNADYAWRALTGFLDRIPHGRAEHDRAIRDHALRLYGAALAGTGKPRFLDKTPRYYFIIKELAALFPAARFVVLLRNPLAVLQSIVDTNLGGRWSGIFAEDRALDVLAAPRLLVDGIAALGPRAIVVRYEQLVREPDAAVRVLCDRLALPFEPDIVRYGGRVEFRDTTFRDPKTIYTEAAPEPRFADAWRERIAAPVSAAMAHGYVRTLGEATFTALGYDHADALALVGHAPPATAAWKLLALPAARRRWWERAAVGTMRTSQQVVDSARLDGVRATLARAWARASGEEPR